MAGAAPVLWDVVEEHLDEAAFLWERRERALGSPLLRPPQVADAIEERLLAHVDGLAFDGALDRVLAPALAEERAGAVAAAALASLEVPGGVSLVLDAVRGAAEARRTALVRALGLSRRPGLERDLLAALADPSPSLVAASLDALAFRRVDPGAALAPLLRSGIPEIHAAALRAARATAFPVRADVERALDSPVPPIRDAALETGLLLGFRGAYAACQRLADSGGTGCARALVLLAMSGDPDDLPRIERALEVPELRRAAVAAVGHAGRPASLERVMDLASDRDAAPLVGEAFSALTGVPVEKDLLAPPAADGGPPPLEEDDLEADLDRGSEGELPVPDPAALAKRWRETAARLDRGTRYLDGRAFTPEALLSALVGGSMRRRHLLALELAVRTRRAVWVETSGWASEQVRAQGMPLPSRPDAKRPFATLLQG